ncbi:DUF7350 domain-containing protein [Halobellus ruber]|uniref:Tat pathway signal protein n=1 Tax=Halobellus ruber TaxID=2761102 RepID=A0A7J9SF68_9EURY|nr:Tat pathway signal protein [Halobellus ruber]MBB6645368.1 Tat pathway signal protein [Halobellus ruber]
MNRREVLAGAGTAAITSLAGCGGVSGLFARPTPEGVYVPDHVEGMEMVGTATLGDVRVGLTYSYPHRFWTVERDGDGYGTSRVDIADDDTVHLMAVPWDPETELVLPNTGLSVAIRTQGELVSQEVIYPMLSQRMGFHYGANFPLDGDGTYEVTVSVGGLSIPRYGGYEGRFDGAAEATIPFEFSADALSAIPYRQLDERRFQPGAVDPMSMDAVPTGVAPDPLPGSQLGRGTSGDAVFLGSVVTADRFGPDPYLAVSARTPYNGLVIPGAGLSASVEGSGPVRLDAAIDPELGFHYGRAVPGLTPASDVEVAVDVPPQVARHVGYETAFLEMPSFTLDAE